MTTAFANHIRRTVDDFLHTVVIVDDEAFRTADAPSDEDHDWDKVADEAPAVVRQQALLRAPTEIPAADELDPRATSKAFGTRGLACAMLSPQTVEENKEVKDPLLQTAGRADLVVFDWMLNGDDGETTLKLFRGLLRADDGVERRLRVVAVYTGEPKLHDIAERMRAVATSELSDHDVQDDSELPQFTCGPVRLTVLAKEYIENLPSELEAQRVAIDDLPDRLADEFCLLCTGLVPGATISALTGIRADAHRLLTALGPDMDSALLGQRVALDQPADVERQLEALITSEIGAVIADRQVGNEAGLRRVKQWLSAQEGLAPGGLLEDVNAAERLRFLTVGLGEDRLAEQNESTAKAKNALRNIRSRATELFVTATQLADDSNKAFAERMTIRTRYRKPDPVLGLGVLVERAGKYLLCVQPACDSVRLKDQTVFPFLRMQVCDCGDESARVVLRDSGRSNRWVALKLEPKPANLALVEFDPGSDEVVRSRKFNQKPTFVATPVPNTTRSRRYRWVADFKPEHAQQIVENLARQFSRVGLAESELLRLRR